MEALLRSGLMRGWRDVDSFSDGTVVHFPCHLARIRGGTREREVETIRRHKRPTRGLHLGTNIINSSACLPALIRSLRRSRAFPSPFPPLQQAPMRSASRGDMRPVVTWKETLEAYAEGDAVKLARPREICSWFPNYKELAKDAIGVTLEANAKEIKRMYGDRDLLCMDILIWAMLEAESEDPVQRARWAAYRSGGGDPSQPVAMMGLPTPGHRMAPIAVEDDPEAPIQEEEDVVMMVVSPIQKPKRKMETIDLENWVMKELPMKAVKEESDLEVEGSSSEVKVMECGEQEELPRRSPRFASAVRRSPRLARGGN